MEKKVLVSIGENTRVVLFSTLADSVPVSDVEALTGAARTSFQDVIPAECPIFFQVKNEEWGGAFVDMVDKDEVPDRSILRAIVSKPGLDVSFQKLAKTMYIPWLTLKTLYKYSDRLQIYHNQAQLNFLNEGVQ